MAVAGLPSGWPVLREERFTRVRSLVEQEPSLHALMEPVFLEEARTWTDQTTFRNRRLLRRPQGLDRLPRLDEQALLRTIDAFLAQAS